MIRINLLPTRQARQKTEGLQQLVLGALLLAIVLGGNAWWYSKLSGELATKKAAVSKLQADIRQLDSIIGEITDISKAKAELEKKLQVLDQLRAGRTGPVKMLDSLATLMPDRVWLTGLDEKSGAITLKGGAVTNEDLADLMRALKESKVFSEPSLKRSVQKADKSLGSGYIEFELTCGVNYSA